MRGRTCSSCLTCTSRIWENMPERDPPGAGSRGPESKVSKEEFVDMSTLSHDTVRPREGPRILF